MVKNGALSAQIWRKSYNASKILCAIFFGCLLFLIPYYWFWRSHVVKNYSAILTETVRNRREAIIAILEDQKHKSNQLSKNSDFVSLFQSLNNVFDGTVTSPAYKQEEAKLDQFFNHYRTNFNYKDIVFVQPNGTMFYTNKIDLISEKNLLNLLSNSYLAQSFDRVLLTFTPDISEFGIDAVTQSAALFICEPVFQNEIFLGVLAIWIDETQFNKVIQNYENLGTTGDIFVTKSVADKELFIAPSRLYPNVVFKKITNSDKYAVTPVRKASLGYEGSGVIIDSFGIEIVGAWLFIPQLNWGLSAGIQLSEISKPLHSIRFALWILTICLLITLAIIIFYNRHSQLVKHSLKYICSRRFIRILYWLGLLLSICASGYFLFKRRDSYSSIFNATKALAQVKIQTEASFIEQQIFKIEKIASMLAQDIQSGSLKKEYIKSRIERDLKDLSDVNSITIAFAPFAYDSKKRLFAYEAQRINSEVKVQELTVDYMIPALKDDPQSGWYDNALKKGAFWSESFFDARTMKQSALYVKPFYKNGDKNELMGVIAVSYNLEKIVSHLKAIEIGKTGYLVLLSPTGNFIYHPLQHYVKDRMNLFDIAREQNNQQLKTVAEQIQAGKHNFGSYQDKSGQLQFWVVYNKIPMTDWTIAALFSKESLDIPVNTFHRQTIWLMVSILMVLFFIGLLISHLELFDLPHVRVWSVLGVITFALGLIFFWYYIYKNPYQPRSDVTIVRDQASLDKFIEFLDLDALQRNEKRPIVTPTGMLVNTITFPDSAKVTISGYVWQKIKTADNVTPGVRFPEAVDFKMREVLKKDNDDKTERMYGWNFTVTFVQKFRFSWFPFDRVHIDILIASNDFEKNIILAPDFNSYQSLEVDPLPGITNKIEIQGFRLDRSFFSYALLPGFDEVGLEKIRKVTEKPRLHYNIILSRLLKNPFIVFFLPLLIILFSTYAVFIVSFRNRKIPDIFQSIGSYTAIFFSLIVLHQTLRSQYHAGELLYIEYFFFYAYITILFLILHSLVLRISRFTDLIHYWITPYLRVLFWPIQFGLWFITTIIIFYTIR